MAVKKSEEVEVPVIKLNDLDPANGPVVEGEVVEPVVTILRGETQYPV